MYKRIFFSRRTVTVAMAGILILGLADALFLFLAGTGNTYDYFDIAAKVLLSVFLFRGYRKEDLQAMQAGCCGLMVCIVCHQASYALGDLFQRSMDSYIEIGFWGSFFLSGELMLLIIEVLIMVNHYMIYVLGRREFLRVRVNQTTVIILLAFSVLQLYVCTQLMNFTPAELLSVCISHFLVFTLYVLVACTELILAIDDGVNR